MCQNDDAAEGIWMLDNNAARVLIMAGGTGGHVFPALAVANYLREAGAAIAWLGTRKGIEADLVPAQQITLHFMDVEGIRGRGLTAVIRAPLLLWRSIVQALKVIDEFKPRVVLGMGGFASGPGAIAARIKGIPIVVHEQNAIAGTTNRIVSRFASQVMEGFTDSLPGGIWCGNPVRREIIDLPRPEQRLVNRSGRVKLLVLGGSRGAKAINELVPQALALLLPQARPQVFHQAGTRHAALPNAVYATLDIEANVVPFIDNMAQAYSEADIVICRAGALTVAELTSVGLGAIFIPYPHAIDDHQTANAKWLVDRGGALLYQQSDLTPEFLSLLLSDLSNDPQRRMNMAIAAHAVAKDRAAEMVAETCMEYFHAAT